MRTRSSRRSGHGLRHLVPLVVSSAGTVVVVSTIELPAAVLARFEAEAARRGVTVDTLLTSLAAGLPESFDPEATTGLPGFVALGASTSGLRARDADEMLADGFGR